MPSDQYQVYEEELEQLRKQYRSGDIEALYRITYLEQRIDLTGYCRRFAPGKRHMVMQDFERRIF